MKLFKSSLLIFIALLATSNTNFAQTNSAELTDQQKEELNKNIEEFAQTLSLSEEQRIQFEEITIKYTAQMMEVRDSDSGKMKKYKKVKSIRKKRNAEMKELLSKDQYKVYLEKQKEIQKKMKERRSNSDG